LLTPMMDLGLPKDQCLEVCRTGLAQTEDYYRIQAAQLLATLVQKHSLESINLEALLQDHDVAVRVYAARAHWLEKHEASAVVPVLLEALNRSKHESY